MHNAMRDQHSYLGHLSGVYENKPGNYFKGYHRENWCSIDVWWGEHTREPGTVTQEILKSARRQSFPEPSHRSGVSAERRILCPC